MAERLGFCFGVKRAVDEITGLLNGEGRGGLWSIGMPIHNPQEVGRLKAVGLKIADCASGIPDGVNVLIRTHGEPRAVIDALRAKGAELIDTTCPFVRRAQELAAEMFAKGYSIVLLGDERHPEIRSIMGHVDGPIRVVSGADAARKLPKMSRAALISQTTQQEALLADVAAVLVPKSGELRVCNTICKATAERQEAARRLAGKVDGVVVEGGKDSANTSKLRDIVAESGTDVLWIETAEEIDRRWAECKERVGVAAGASTPDWLITEVREALEGLFS